MFGAFNCLLAGWQLVLDVTQDGYWFMVKDKTDFVVYDAKTGDDITRSVLAQIIFEQENKAGQNLLPTTFLRQLIRFYGDSMQKLVPSYLEFSLDSLTRQQEQYRRRFAHAFGKHDKCCRLLHNRSE